MEPLTFTPPVVKRKPEEAAVAADEDDSDDDSSAKKKKKKEKKKEKKEKKEKKAKKKSASSPHAQFPFMQYPAAWAQMLMSQGGMMNGMNSMPGMNGMHGMNGMNGMPSMGMGSPNQMSPFGFPQVVLEALSSPYVKFGIMLTGLQIPRSVFKMNPNDPAYQAFLAQAQGMCL